METLFKTLGNYLKQKRIENELTQEEVARALGYSTPQFISNFERGTCAPPMKKLGTLIRLYRLNSEEVLNLLMTAYESQIRRELKLGSRRSGKNLKQL